MIDPTISDVAATLAIAVLIAGLPLAWRRRSLLRRSVVGFWQSVPQWPVIRNYRVRRIRKKAAKAARLQASLRVFPPPDDEYEEEEIPDGEHPDDPQAGDRESA